MKKGNKAGWPRFSESYFRLCLTEGIKSEFGSPSVRGNYCIDKTNPKQLCRVEHFAEKETYIYCEKGGTYAKTLDLIWLPTVIEIKQNFMIKDAGFTKQYENFINYPDPKNYGYSRADLSQFPSKEERWLLYGMWVKCQRIFDGKNWIPFRKK
jgi:hypothetical protein